MTKTCVMAWMLGLLLAVFFLVPGCGTKDANRGAIHGEVKLDGQPIEQGSITFTPTGGTKGTVTGGQIEKGRYQLSAANGPAIGQNIVEIRAMQKTGRMIPQGFGATGEMIEEQVDVVAPQFNSASTLEAEVKPGDNTVDFNVTSK